MKDGSVLRDYIDNQKISKKTIAQSLNMSRQNLYQLFESDVLEEETKRKFNTYFKVDIFSNVNIDRSKKQENVYHKESKADEPAGEYNQPIIQVVLNLSYIGKKNADSIDKMADSNLLNAKSIATLVNLLASNSDLSALIDPSRTSQDMPDDLPVEAFLGKGGSDALERQKQAGRKKVGHK